MSVQKMLEYQKIDLNIYKKEKDLSNSNEMKRMLLLKEQVKNKREMLDNLLAELDKCYSMLVPLEKKLDEESEKKAAYEEDFSEYTDIKDYDRYEKSLEKFEESLNTIIKDIQRIIKKISEINESNKKINDQISKLITDFNIAKEQAEEKRKSLLKEAIPFAKQLKVIEPEIDGKLLAKYKELRQKKKMPAFVPYSDGSCMGCGIGIEVEVGKHMVNLFDCAECPHCGRIVYKLSAD